jgi:L-seryl-tRNA(Ser) seleniumtransferase
MSLAALEATLLLHRDRPERVPIMSMLAQGEAALQERAERLQAMLNNGEIEVSAAFAGGGALPEEAIASRALALDPACGAEAAARRLRAAAPPVIARIHQGRLLLDMFTIADGDLPELAAALLAVLE